MNYWTIENHWFQLHIIGNQSLYLKYTWHVYFRYSDWFPLGSFILWAQKREPVLCPPSFPGRARYGVSFVSSKCNLYFAIAFAVLYTAFSYIPCFVVILTSDWLKSIGNRLLYDITDDVTMAIPTVGHHTSDAVILWCCEYHHSYMIV